MFNIIIENEETGKTEVKRTVDSFVLLDQIGNKFSKTGAPDNLVVHLGMLHFALNQIQGIIGKDIA